MFCFCFAFSYSSLTLSVFIQGKIGDMLSGMACEIMGHRVLSPLIFTERHFYKHMADIVFVCNCSTCGFVNLC